MQYVNDTKYDKCTCGHPRYLHSRQSNESNRSDCGVDFCECETFTFKKE